LNLPEEDVELFFKLFPALCMHANRRLGVLDGVATEQEFLDRPNEERVKVRDALYEHVELIDEFADQNPAGFSAEELVIVRSWKNCVRGRFYVLRFLKSYAVFLDSSDAPKAYGVCCLHDSFEMLCPFIPLFTRAVLLPFRDRIAYDGYLNCYNMTMGPGIRRRLNESYGEAKARFGIITRLPFSPEEGAPSEVERLRDLLRSESSRKCHEDEIQALVESGPELRRIYHEEMGKVHARRYRKLLRARGVRAAWFALYKGIVVASGKTREEVRRTLGDILPPEAAELAYLFQVKGEEAD
jgi:hypothetical protein